MAANINILFTGATGYLGGGLLERLIAHSQAHTFTITAVVRATEKAAALTVLGVNAVPGTLADLARLEKLAADADVIFSMANCDDVDAAKALLRGVKARHVATGVAPIFIHTSGVAVVMDRALGAHASTTVYSDLDAAAISALPDTQVHRPVDLVVHAADRAGYARTFIVAPPNVFGTAAGPFVARGIQNAHSQINPLFIRIALARGRAPSIGAGNNIWPAVHVTDMIDLYVRLFDAARAVTAPHGEGYYFAENGEYALSDLATAIGHALLAAGRTAVAEATPLAPAEIETFLGGEAVAHVLGSNSRCRADRARSLLGWAPLTTAADMLAGIPDEVKAVIQ